MGIKSFLLSVVDEYKKPAPRWHHSLLIFILFIFSLGFTYILLAEQSDYYDARIESLEQDVAGQRDWILRLNLEKLQMLEKQGERIGRLQEKIEGKKR